MTDPAQLADLAINQPDVALIFEGVTYNLLRTFTAA